MTPRHAEDHPEATIRLWWLHPFLVAAFPVLFLFSQNINEQLSLDPLWAPLAIALGVAAAVLLVALTAGVLLGVERARMSIVASLLIGLALTYGHAWNLVGEALGLHRFLLVAWGALAITAIVVTLLARRSLIGRATTAVAAGAAILVVINLVPIVGLGLRTVGAEMVSGPGGSGGAGGSGSGRDVWYLVFDRYAGSPSLERIYGYDNSPFLDELRERGFAVAAGATANYLKTALSLASSLNMAQLDAEALADEATNPEDWTPVYRQLQGSHAVERFLHERDYRYLHLGLRRGATYANASADVEILVDGTTEFSAVFADTTILAAAESLLPPEVAVGTEDLYARQTLFQLDELERLVDLPGRNFVFAHVLLPHPPYFFNADGTRVTSAQAAARTAKEAYVEQLRFANARILALLDRLQAGSESTWPIVVLAADEGPFPDRYAANELEFRWNEATDDELLQKFSILTAVLVPGTEPSELAAAGFSDAISPLNLFRVVFNAAFEADLPPLPDRAWIFTDQRHIYDSVDITDRVRAVVDAARTAP